MSGIELMVDSEPSPDSNVYIETVELLAEDKETEIRKADRLLKLQLQRTVVAPAPDGGVPIVATNSAMRFKDFAQLFDSGDRSHEAGIWRLCSALFDEVDLRLPADADDELVFRLTQIRRKLALSKWLETAVAPSVDHDLVAATTAPEKAFSLLSGNQIERATQAALDGNDLRLATLVSQVGSSDQLRGEVTRQLDDWQKYKVGSLIGQQYRRVYALVAGYMDVLPGDSSRGVDGCPDVIISEGLDWKRAFGLRLWYGLPLEEPISSVLALFTDELSSVHAPARPLPPYLEKPGTLTTTWTMDTEPTDILFDLIRLFSDAGVSLEQVLRARGCSPSPLDNRLPWHLYMLFAEVMKKRDFEDREDAYSASADALTQGYASQLEQLGLWTWSAFILLHLETRDSKEKAVKALLHRHPYVTQEEVDFLVEKLHLPSKWIAEAEAAKLVANNDMFASYKSLIVAEKYDPAHRVLVDKLVPEVVIRGDNAVLKTLCEMLPGDEVKDWEYGGKVILDYMAIMDELPNLLIDIIRSPADSVRTSRRLEELVHAVPRVIGLLPALFPDRDDVQQISALGDMLSGLHALARQVHLAGYVSVSCLTVHG